MEDKLKQVELKCPKCKGEVKYFHSMNRGEPVTEFMCKKKCEGLRLIEIETTPMRYNNE